MNHRPTDPTGLPVNPPNPPPEPRRQPGPRPLQLPRYKVWGITALERLACRVPTVSVTVADATAEKEVDFKVEQTADGKISVSVIPFQF